MKLTFEGNTMPACPFGLYSAYVDGTKLISDQNDVNMYDHRIINEQTFRIQ